MRPTVAIIPSAGLGTRLRPLTDACPKEMLRVGGQPLIYASFLEAEAAELADVVVVVSPDKPALVDWLHAQAGAWPFAVHLATQPEPRGVVDAVACAREVVGREPYAVLYPDYVAGPDQRALAELIACADGGSTIMGSYEVAGATLGRFGRTARAAIDASGAIHELVAAELVPGARHTTFAEVRTAAYDEALVACASTGLPRDADVLPTLNQLAQRGLLRAVDLSGRIHDAGVPAGLQALRAAFDDGVMRWRR